MVNILIVSGTFPPQGAKGSRRLIQLSKYFSQNGFTVKVLTKKINLSLYKRLFYPLDLNKEKELKEKWNIFIIKSFTLENFYYRLKLKKKSLFNDISNHIGKKKIVNYSWSDISILWFPFALFSGIIIKTDYIISSTPSYLNLIIGYILSVIKLKPLILDYRDAWLLDPSVAINNRDKKIIALIEGIILKRAHFILFTTLGMLNTYKNYYKLNNSKCLLLRNGYQSSDRMIMNKLDDKDYFYDRSLYNVSYIGTLNTGRDPEDLFKNCSKIKCIEDREICLNFIGASLNDINFLNQLAGKYKIRTFIKGNVDRDLSLKIMKQSDCLVLLINENFSPGSAFGIPGKLGDYILAEKPIIVNTSAINFLKYEFNDSIKISDSKIEGYSLLQFNADILNIDKNLSEYINKIFNGQK